MKTIPPFITGCLVGCVFIAAGLSARAGCQYLLDTKKSPSVPTKSVCSGPPIVEVLAELDAGCPGTLVFEGADGQCLRMWQIPHRMEAWLMGQKNIHIEDMYYFDHRTTNEPASLRYYIRYQVLKEK